MQRDEEEWQNQQGEPSDMGWAKSFPECAKLFQRAGWYKYFEKNDCYHSEVSYGFAQVSKP